MEELNIMNIQLDSISKAWPSIKNYFTVPHSEQEYTELVNYLDALIDEVGDKQNHELAPVMETIGLLIENYENKNYKIDESTVVEVIKYLMQEHALNQVDMTEIGSQGVVSEILSGQRNLNIDQIKRLSKKFNLSPSVFI
jgi:HTH-type transcriptional regulator/antitoxin HigA